MGRPAARQAWTPPITSVAVHSEPPHRRGGEARLIALVADQDHPPTTPCELGIAVL